MEVNGCECGCGLSKEKILDSFTYCKYVALQLEIVSHEV